MRIRNCRCIALIACVLAVVSACASAPRREQRSQEVGAPKAAAHAPAAGAPAQNAPAADEPAPAAVAAPEAPKNKLSEAYTIKVTGMTCRFVCVREVVEALKSVPGVSNVIIDFDEHKAIVHCAPGTNPDDLMTALQASGKYSGIVLP